ncbi:unnamed protein product [Callosobruchus maculatus]|uniref:THAP-type domain-containing protein n=1 Tax=Callosobruchus maculatus TaxID=64391 RepID=A0A653DJL3_CALMS|nr:unnamed protein product [Callosobruchus maculatus]
MQWVQNSGRPEFFEQFAFEGALPFLTRFICSDHFGDSDYLDVTNRDLGLKSNAIPRLNLILGPVEPEVDLGEDTENIDIKQEPLETEESPDMTDQKPTDPEDPLKVPVPPLKFGDEGFYDSLHLSTMLNGDGSYTSNESCDSSSQTDEGRALRDLFFCRYETAVDTENKRRRMNETEEQRRERLQRAALEAKRKRTTETEEEKKLRRMKNALATALRRRRETPEQTAARREKGRIRARLKRMTETEEQTKARREKGRIRARLKRMTETEEESKARRERGRMRARMKRMAQTGDVRASHLGSMRQ